MVFSSIEFLWFFMPAVLALYLLLPPRARNALLAAVSVVFYAWGAHALVLLFLASIAANFAAGLLIARTRTPARRAAVWTSRIAVAANLPACSSGSTPCSPSARSPRSSVRRGSIGSASRTSRCRWASRSSRSTASATSSTSTAGRARPMRSVADYGQYMAFFPQLIAGPIVRYHEIDDQIRSPPPRSQRLGDIAEGFPRFALGLTQEGRDRRPAGRRWPTRRSTAPGHPSFATAWVGALAYTVQIYFDFSGYSDMAIGLARMFGFRFPENFDRPYSSVSMTDFWRRWHMSLSRWFRDYVYIPLGGSRGSRRRRRSATCWFVFLLTGAWHGAAWTFVLWGLYNGTLLVVRAPQRRGRAGRPPLADPAPSA